MPIASVRWSNLHIETRRDMGLRHIDFISTAGSEPLCRHYEKATGSTSKSYARMDMSDASVGLSRRISRVESLMSQINPSTHLRSSFYLGAHARRALLWVWRELMPRDEGYSPERYYMRGRGPKWREKQLALKRRGL